MGYDRASYNRASGIVKNPGNKKNPKSKKKHKYKQTGGGLVGGILNAFSFIKKHWMLASIALVVVVGVTVGTVLIVNHHNSQYESMGNVDDYDPDLLAGITGEGLSSDYNDDIAFANTIGVIVDDMSGEKDKVIVQSLEELASQAVEDRMITGIRFYNSKGNLNQQVQDMRSMINLNVKAVIIYIQDAKTFTTMAELAASAGIPVIAIDAPISSGYDVNIKTDTSAFGALSEKYISDNVKSGEVLPVIAADASTVETERMAEILGASLNGATKLDTVTVESGKVSSVIAANLGKDISCVVAGMSIAKETLQELIYANDLPNVLIGDTSAGFIKLWYQLKSEGINVSASNAKTKDRAAFFITEKQGTKIFAESGSFESGSVALQFALRFVSGKKIDDSKLSSDKTFLASCVTYIDDNTLWQYYEQVKDKDDDYYIYAQLDDSVVDSYFLSSEG